MGVFGGETGRPQQTKLVDLMRLVFWIPSTSVLFFLSRMAVHTLAVENLTPTTAPCIRRWDTSSGDGRDVTDREDVLKAFLIYFFSLWMAQIIKNHQASCVCLHLYFKCIFSSGSSIINNQSPWEVHCEFHGYCVGPSLLPWSFAQPLLFPVFSLQTARAKWGCDW